MSQEPEPQFLRSVSSAYAVIVKVQMLSIKPRGISPDAWSCITNHTPIMAPTSTRALDSGQANEQISLCIVRQKVNFNQAIWHIWATNHWR